jgi:WD40 repeat protein
MADVPWSPIIRKAVAKDPEERFSSAHELSRSLEEVAFRVHDEEGLEPYPGLSAFGEDDAEFFFGREAEIETVWKKLQSTEMLGLIGASGSGKSSFIRAGLIPAKPEGWEILVCTPGKEAVASLRQALVPAIEGNSRAIQKLAAGGDASIIEAFSSLRQRVDQVILIVDQFEELFTQNGPEEQARFAGLLGKLALAADVHILISIRDDFLIQCNRYDELRPIFSELTAFDPPHGSALRRAVVQPAFKCGYRFEDEELADEILAEVEGERGALPLLAFALAQLWEKRDREQGRITRQAFHDIGGVGGSLARHAEAAVDRIGSEHIAVVRELFRNLVTAEGTRAARSWDELLSVFDPGDLDRAGIKPAPTKGATVGAGFTPARETAKEVLRELIDARLLTSYEVREEDRDPTRQVEISHESLIANWPRLVRWQTQDQEGAQLRDELRQAARNWEEHDRSDDRLWAGTAFREYRLWRERYPGGLTETEEAFAAAMTSLATRRKRRRRVAATVGVAVLLAVLTAVTGLWRRSVQQTRRAEAETNRAEASKLLTLGESVLEEWRTWALAYAIASIELADTPEARRLALKALWAGPPATKLPDGGLAGELAFAPDGRHLAVGDWRGLLRVFSRDGGAPTRLEGLDGKGHAVPFFSPDSHLFVAGAGDARGEVVVWATEGGPALRTIQTIDSKSRHDWALGFFEPDGAAVLTAAFEYDGSSPLTPGGLRGRYLFQRWPLGGGGPQILGALACTRAPLPIPDFGRGLIVNGDRDELHLHRLDALGTVPPRVIARYPEVFAVASRAAFDPTTNRVAASDASGNLWLWPLDGDGSQPERKLKTPGAPSGTTFSPDGSLLAYGAGEAGGFVWDLRGPAGADPLRLAREGIRGVAFTPDGRWLASARGGMGLALWPLPNKWPRTLRVHDGNVHNLAFAPDGSRLFTLGRNDGKVLSVSLTGGAGLEPEVMLQMERQLGWGLEVDDRGRFLIVSGTGEVWKIPTNGTAPSRIKDLDWFKAGDLDPSGRLLAAPVPDDPVTSTVIVTDLETGERRELDGPGSGQVSIPAFDPAGRMLVARGGLLSRWDPLTGVTEALIDEGVVGFELSPDGRSALYWGGGSVFLTDLEQQQRTAFAIPSDISWLNFDPSGELLIVGTHDGEVQVRPISGGEPHLLLGHRSSIWKSAVSPDGLWIASAANDGTVRLWPMPDLSKPPLHTLPHDELLARLKSLTNYRAVPDEESYTGYSIEPDFTAYRGWETVPTW